MRSYQVFASMTPERATEILRVLKENSPDMFRQAVDAASLAIKARPVYLRKQPFEKQAATVRRALARVVANPVADEFLAIYFLECKKELLIEWLDAIGVEHEDGSLTGATPAEPPADALRKAVEEYRAKGDDPDRQLMLQAFAAQNAVDWPTLEELL